MIFLFALLTAVSVALLTFGVVSITTGQSRVVRRRLSALRGGDISYRELKERRRREEKRRRVELVLEAVGDRVQTADDRRKETEDLLIQAGYRSKKAAAIYTGVRMVSAIGFAIGGVLLLGVLEVPPRRLVFWTLAAAAVGWFLPLLWVRHRRRQRQTELQRVLPDMLDLLVVCVEAGLGLNQALLRVAEEIEHISPAMSDELTVVNLEIRAGQPREEALRNLGERSGLKDLRSLVTMLIQTDRFGTSVADALRVHAETLRSIRMQRAEEKAAKVSAKLVFPLVLFIFPATSVVILGPGLIQVFEMFDFLG